MTKTITFNELRRIKDSLPDGSMHRIADELNVTTQTVRNYFGGSNYSFGKNCGLHIEPGPDRGIVVLDNTQIYDMAIRILEEENKNKRDKLTMKKRQVDNVGDSYLSKGSYFKRRFGKSRNSCRNSECQFIKTSYIPGGASAN